MKITDGMKIILSHVYPPIPDRRHDWCAYIDGFEENTWLQGWGRDAITALRDLADQMETDEDE